MRLRLALDWIPNTLHAGFLIAEAKGYYKDDRLEVEFISPDADHFATTPVEKLARREVHLAIAPTESVINFNMRKAPTPLMAVAATLQQDTSAIVTLEESGINRPAKIDGRRFAAYGFRFESDIIRQLVKNDGGKGEFQFSHPGKLEVWENLIEGKVDAGWIFLPWEGLKAKYERSLKFHAFQMADYGIPYGYSPLIISHQDFISEESEAIRIFLQASERGWRDVHAHPEKAAKVLHKHVQQKEFENLDFLEESLRMIQPTLFTQNDRWGFMEGQRWVDFIDWMIQCQILKDEEGVPMNHGQIDSSMLYTNEFFK